MRHMKMVSIQFYLALYVESYIRDIFERSLRMKNLETELEIS